MTRPASGRPTVLIHVGEPKTGTTYLQELMFANREVLLDQGVLVPVDATIHTWRVVQDLREVEQKPNDPMGPHAGAWNKMVRVALRAPRVAVLSHELLAAATTAQAERAVRSFGDAEVHVAITVRDISAVLPAEWQESIKHQNALEWERWLGDVIDRESVAPNRDEFWFWTVHDTLAILRRWTTLVPPERVHVVTVPPPGASQTLLWERFASLIGVDPAIVDTSLVRANASLSLAQTELLRRVNERLPESTPGWFYMWHVKEALAHQAWAKKPGRGGARLALPESRDEWAAKHTAGVVAELGASGYDVIGDLDELVPRVRTGPRGTPQDAAAEDIAEAGVDAIAKLLRDVAVLVGVVDATEDDGTSEVARTRVRKAKDVAIRFTQRHMWAHRLRRGYWKAANVQRRRLDRMRGRPGR